MGKKKRNSTEKTAQKPDKVSVRPIINYSKPLKNDRHEKFCQVYVKDPINCLNNTLAYMAVYPKCTKVSAGVNGFQLLKNAIVVGRVQYLQKEVSDKAGVTNQMLMDELKKIGFSNIDDYLRIDNEGNVLGRDFENLDRDKLAAIESIKQTINITHNKGGDREYETRNFQFKLHDKIGAIREMGKHIGFYEKDNIQRGFTLRIG